MSVQYKYYSCVQPREREKKSACYGAHRIGILKVQLHRDRAVFALVPPADWHILLRLLCDLRAKRSHVADESTLVIPDDFNLEVARILLHIAECSRAVDVWQIESRRGAPADTLSRGRRSDGARQYLSNRRHESGGWQQERRERKEDGAQHE